MIETAKSIHWRKEQLGGCNISISTFIYGSWSLRYQEHVFLHKGGQDGPLNEIEKHARPNLKRALIKLISSCLQFLDVELDLNWRNFF